MRGHRHFYGVLLMSLAIGMALFGLPQAKTNAAATGQTIAFQARILSKDRLNAPSGQFSFRFSIYNNASTGSALWAEQWSVDNKIQVRHGVFNADLGSINPLTASLFTNDNLYLTVEFDSDNNGSFDQLFLSRIPLTAVPYAFSAHTLDGKTADSFVTTTSNTTITGNWLFQGGVSIGTLNGILNASNGTLGVATTGNITGTSNQITVTGGAGAALGSGVTLALPQDIATTSTPTFASLNVNSSGTIAIGDASIYRSSSQYLQTASTFSAYRLIATHQNGSIYTNDSASNVYALIRSYQGKNGWLAFTEDSVADRWSVGIKAGDASLHIGTGGPGAYTDRFSFIAGAFNMLAQSDLRMYDADSSNYVGFQSPTTVGSNVIWTLPDSDGTSGQCLSTDAAGTLSWADCAGGSGAPTTASYITLGTNGTLSAERVLTGTTNQVAIADNGANNTVVLSTPQDIATSSAVQFGSLGLGSAASGALIHAYKPTADTNPSRIRLQTGATANGALTEWGYVDGSGGLMVGQNYYWNDTGSETRYDTGTSAWALVLGSGSGSNNQTVLIHTTAAGTRTAPLTVDGAGQLVLSGQGSTAGILIGGDTNLYRAASNTLKTDDSFSVGTNLAVTGNTTLATSLTGMLKASSGLVSAGTADVDYQQPITWGNGLTYSAGTADADYNTTNLKITAAQLNTIQDIATSSTVQFGGLGIGTTAGSYAINATHTSSSDIFQSYNLQTLSTSPNAGSKISLSLNNTVNPSSAASASAGYYSILGKSTLSASSGYSVNGSLYGVEGGVHNESAQTLAGGIGGKFATRVMGAGDISNAYGIVVWNGTGTGSTGNITNQSVGISIYNALTDGSGTIATQYGIKIAAQTAGTSDIGLYIADADTYSLQLASTDGDAASGITFGTDISLYRSAVGQLTIDNSAGDNALVLKGRDGIIRLQHEGGTLGNSDLSTFLSFYDGTQRVGWTGYGWGYTDAMAVANEAPGKPLYLTTTPVGNPVGSDVIALTVNSDSTVSLTSQLLFATGTTSANGILWGADTNLYRADVNVLKSNSSFTAGDGTGYRAVAVNGGAGNARDLRLQTNSLDRWLVRAEATAESGSNAGSNFEIQARKDDGTPLSTPLSITRSSGLVTFGAHIAVEGVTSTGATGTNKLVFDTSPTLVTPTLGAATYTTLSGGNITDSALTAGRVTYAGTAGILQDSANMTFDTTNGLKLAAGSTSAMQLTSTAGTAAGGILFGTDTNIYRGAANELRTDDLLSFSSTKTNTTTDFKTYKSDGGFGFIFDTSSTYSTGSLISVRNNGSPKFTITASGNVMMAGTLTQNTTPADIAENIPVSDPTITAGDIVTADPAHPGSVMKATSADYGISGVISTEPGILLSGATSGKPLVLAGRVPVKVTDSNGLIHAGDIVVPSVTPGRGEKAGGTTARMIGVALSNQKTANDTVTVQLQIGYYSPALGATSSTSALSPQQQAVLGAIDLLSNNVLSISSLQVRTLTVAESLYVNGTAVFANAPVFPSNTTGTAIVPAGQSSVHVTFAKPHSILPTVTVSITAADVSNAANIAAQQYNPVVVQPTTHGFSVVLSKPAVTDVPVSWIAITSAP